MYICLGKENHYVKKMNVESFVETLKKLLRPFETDIVHFVYVDDSYLGKKM